jgi:hypothetical protein
MDVSAAAGTREGTGAVRRGLGERTSARRALPVLLVALAVLVAALLAGPGQEGAPLDPRSPGPSGTLALLDTLRELDVDVALEPDGLDDRFARALILIDDLTEDERDGVRAWIEAGGVLVVADPRSAFAPEAIGTAAIAGFGIAAAEPECALPALAEVDAIILGRDAVVYDEGAQGVGCFPRNDGFLLVAEPVGDGAIVALGGPDPWVNQNLDVRGHPELAVALLVDPQGGALGVLRTRLPGGGDATLADLIGDNVRLFALQLLVALLLVVGWRARRLGKPVSEPQPVAIPGSELVTAVGHLLQESGSRARAAEVLRADLHRTLEHRFGLPRGDVRVVAAAVAARTGMPTDELERVLTGDPPADEAALVALAHDIEDLRAQLLHAAASADGADRADGAVPATADSAVAAPGGATNPDPRPTARRST